MDNKLKEKERDDAQKELLRREEELTQVRSKLKQVEGKGSVANEEEINSKVDERTQMMRFELMKTEEMMLQQKEEISRLKRRLEVLESDKSKAGQDALDDIDGGRFMKHLSEIYTGDHTMVVSMDLDMGDHQPSQVVKEIKEDQHQCENIWNGSSNAHLSDGEDEVGAVMLRLPDNVCLSTVFEEDAEGEDRESTDEDEVDKEVVEESIPHFTRKDSVINSENFVSAPNYIKDGTTENEKDATENPSTENEKDSLAFRKTRIQNIFRLCGNHRELSHQVKIPAPTKTEDANIQSSPQMDLRTISKAAEIPISASHEPLSSLHHADQLKSTAPLLFKNACELHEESKENSRPGELEEDELVMIYVKWEASKDFSGSLIKKMKVRKDSTLSDLRKQIEDLLDGDKQFTFLLLGDPTGAPLAKDKEATFQVSKLPSCSSQLNGHLACLRPIKKAVQQPDHVPFGSLENTLAKLAAF